MPEPLPARSSTDRRRASAADPASRSWLPRLDRLFPQAAAAAIAFALVGTGWMGWEHWQQQPNFDRAYATDRGQQLTVSLPDARGVSDRSARQDGSTLQLDTATRVHAQLYRDRREIHLNDGQAMFSVHADAQRPFHVRAGALRVTVLGTRFSVRHTASGMDAGKTVVSVEEGRVRVARVDHRAEERDMAAAGASTFSTPVELTAGQAVVAEDSGHFGPVTSLPLSAIAGWRAGRISFDETPLAQAVAEFERYGRTGLSVRDPAVAALPVGGSYSVQHFQRFVDTLPQVLPVRLVRRGEVTEIVAR